MDSGACDTVMPEELCKGIKVEDSAASKEGVVYETAGGDQEIPNLGQRKCLLMTLGAKQPRRITCQVADIHKPLLSVSNVCGAGFECRSGKAGGVLRYLQTGEDIPIERRNLCIIKACVKADRTLFTRHD